MEGVFLNTCWNEIHKIIDEAMEKRDRTVAIYISPDGGMSVNLSPWPEPAESSDCNGNYFPDAFYEELYKKLDINTGMDLHNIGRITPNRFRKLMGLPEKE